MLTRVRTSVKQPLLGLILGLIYGAGLTAAGFFAAGAGHGTFTLLALASSPAGLAQFPGTILVAPVLWALVGWLLSNKKRKRLLLTIMLLHYAGAVYLLTVSEYADWDRFAISPSWALKVIVLGFSWYLLGQVVLWILFLQPENPATLVERQP